MNGEVPVLERPVARLARALGCTDGQAWTLLITLVLALLVMLIGLPPTLRAESAPGPRVFDASLPPSGAAGRMAGGPESGVLPAATTPPGSGAAAGQGGGLSGPGGSASNGDAGGAGANPAVGAQPVAVPGLPDGVPPAALAPEPPLPAPAGWPFPESFPRTSGTGRLDGGAFYWADFLYDDHGATGQGAKWYHGQYRTSGTYSYPPGPAQSPGNGIGEDNAADLFRVAIGLDPKATYWRVDWNTLLDARHPIAAFGIDLDPTAAAATTVWPGVPGLRSSGVDLVLLVSSRGAWLLRGGERRQVSSTVVDLTARSFVVRLPRTTLPPSSTWRVRVVSGVATDDGQGFLPVGPDLGGAPGQPPVYNVSFRQSAQEMATLRQLQGAKVRGLYTDKAQAEALTNGDISSFAADVDWSALADRRTTPEPLVRGPSNRWYVSSIELGQGVLNTMSAFSDNRPNLLGRVQPYTVWVPERYDPYTPVAATLLIHPNGSTHNEYVDSPKLMQTACEDPVSICVTPAGRSPDQAPSGEMELDFWEVWNRVAAAYRLDADRTRIFGFSQGGGVVNHLVMTYPDLFARAAVFAPGCCGDDDRVANLRWLPLFLGEPAADPTLGYAAPEAQRLAALGYRHRFEVYPDQDHASFGYRDRYTRGARYLGSGSERRMTEPGRITYLWSHANDRPDLGFGVQGAYWLRSVRAREADAPARMDATTHARPDPPVTPVSSTSAPTDDPAPAVASEVTWTTGAAPVSRPVLDLSLANVGEAAVALDGAGFRAGEAGTISITTDGPSVLALRGLRPGALVTVGGGEQVRADADGTALVHVERTTKTIGFGGTNP